MFDSFMKAGALSQLTQPPQLYNQQITALEAPKLVQPPQLYSQPGPPPEGVPGLYNQTNPDSLKPEQWVAFNQQRQQAREQLQKDTGRTPPAFAPNAPYEMPRDPSGYPTINPHANEGLLGKPNLGSEGEFATRPYYG